MNNISLHSHFDSFPAAALFSWYDGHARRLPWRAISPEMAPAYHVFLSELMLQQTVVTTVIPYFNQFISRWPDIYALAGADDDAVLAAWAGLGYYARARNMLKAVREIVSSYDGKFPETPEDLQKLPGIGPYTAGAIAAIAFARPAIVLDGNVERILVRYAGIDEEVRAVKPALKEIYQHICPEKRRPDFPQALMDVGAGVCQPRRTNCGHCPLRKGCKAATLKDPASLPVRPQKKAKPVRQGAVYIIRNQRGEVLLGKRPDKGLLGGMLTFPSHGWDGSACPEWLAAGTSGFHWRKEQFEIRHVFTHFTAIITVYDGKIEPGVKVPNGYNWQLCSPDKLPSLMAKCYQAAQIQPS